eukprot:2021664-Rhodomonas_salina.1
MAAESVRQGLHRSVPLPAPTKREQMPLGCVQANLHKWSARGRYCRNRGVISEGEVWHGSGFGKFGETLLVTSLEHESDDYETGCQAASVGAHGETAWRLCGAHKSRMKLPATPRHGQHGAWCDEGGAWAVTEAPLPTHERASRAPASPPDSCEPHTPD